jgi:hypothetical protein
MDGERGRGRTKEDHDMRRTITAIASLAVFLTVSAAGAQMRPTTPTQSPTQSTQGHSPGGHAPGHQSQQPMMGHMGQGQGMCPMMGMGGMMGGGMMGGMMGSSADPKAQARMLKLRGDMMKAMGDVLLKHAQEVEQGK